MKKRQLSNPLKIGKGLLSLFALFMLLLTPERAWADEVTTTYTFTGMSNAESGSDYQYDVKSTVGSESRMWKLKNLTATDDTYVNSRETSGYVSSTNSFSISNIDATSTSGTVVEFALESDFMLTGSFVSAKITYSTTSMSSSEAVVHKVNMNNGGYDNLTYYNRALTEPSTTLSLDDPYVQNRIFEGNKIALEFRFVTNEYDGSTGSFTIQSIEITTNPIEYNLWIAGTQVTSDNASNVMGNANTPTVVFDATNNTLTLNNAQITVNGDNAIQSELDNLTVFLVGEQNTITCQGGTDCAFKGTSTGNETVTFATNPSAVGFLQVQVNTEEQLFSDISAYYSQELSLKSESSSTYDIGVFLSGEGTEESPYVISSAIELGVFATKFYNGYLEKNCYVELGDNIDCTNLTSFKPIGSAPGAPFWGKFDGNGNTISKLTYTTTDGTGYAGLFGVVGWYDNGSSGCYVQNLNLENCSFSGGQKNGAIAAVFESGTIDNCNVTNCTVSTSGSVGTTYCGGIAGEVTDGKVTDCTASGLTMDVSTTTPDGTTFVGGIVGQTANEVSECEVTGTESNPTVITAKIGPGGSGAAGGIVGLCAGNAQNNTISNNTVSGKTTINSIDPTTFVTDYSCAGAIVGDKVDGTLTSNYYYYSVTTSNKKGENDAIEKKGHEQRGMGKEEIIEDISYYDIINGAELANTKKLTINMEHVVEGGPNDYYALLSDYKKGEFYIVSGQKATVLLQTEDNYSITSASLSYTTTQGADPTVVNLEIIGEGNMFECSLTMPDYEATLNVTYTAKPSIWIGDVEVREDGTFPDYDEEVASFNSQTNTLTLNGISYSGEIRSGLNALTIKVTGTTNQIGKIVSLNPAATLTFEKAGAEAEASLSLNTAQMAEASSVISGFASIDFGDMYLSSSTPYQYDTTNKLLVNPTVDENNEITSVTVTSATAYPLWVGGTQVTGSSVVSDNIRRNGVYDGDDYGITFTAGETNILQLKRVGILIFESHKPAIVSGLDNLTIQLVDRNEINFNGDNACYMVASANDNATLTFKAAGDDALLTASIGNSQYIGSPANGFQTVSYDDNLVYIAYGTNTQYIKKLDAPNVSLSDGYLMLSSEESNGDNMESLIFKYSVDYVDASLADITNATYAEGTSPEISSPCTITAHAEYNGKIGIEATAKYFGFTEPLTITYNGTAFELTTADLPALAPTVADGDDVTYQIGGVSEGTAVTYDEQTKKYMVQSIGTADLEINLMQGDNTPYQVLNRVASLTVNVVAALDIEFVGSNLWASYYSTENLTVPTGLTAYVVSNIDGATGAVTVASVDYIPANNAVLLKREQNGAADGYVATPYADDPDEFTNLLGGSTSATAISSLNSRFVYVLFNDKFKRATSGTIPARRAYLAFGATTAPTSAPQYLTINIVDGNSTGVNDVRSKMAEVGGDYYDLSGRKLQQKPAKKGLYIQNGKKVYINNNK